MTTTILRMPMRSLPCILRLRPLPAFAVAALVALAVSGLAGSASARLVDAIHAYDGQDASTLPATLSKTGLYDPASSNWRTISSGIVPFEVNSPLWSDGSAKQRWVALPAGTKITPTDSDGYVFPDKAVLIKNFMIDTVYGDSLTRILVETRFLVVRADPGGPAGARKWLGISYRWRRNQGDADLVDPQAGLDTVHLVKLNGAWVGKRWRYPSRGDCNDCHKGRGVLGFITPQLNRPSKAQPAVNQLEALFTAGVLSANVYKPALHRWVGLKETGTAAPAAMAAAKARSYLASNCSHCHGNRQSPEGVEHSFDWFTAGAGYEYPEDKAGYVGKATTQEPGYGRVVQAGWPESSYVMLRLLARGDLGFYGFQAMPPLATYQPDSAAVTAVRDWICSLGPRTGPCKAPEVQADDSYWERIAVGLRFHGSGPRGMPGTRAIQSRGTLLLPSGTVLKADGSVSKPMPHP